MEGAGCASPGSPSPSSSASRSPASPPPNPFTSGGARWNVMAAYGGWLKQGLSPKQAQAKLLALFKNVTVQDSSARNALNTFLAGKGDVLLTYENEAIAAQL